MKSKQNWLWKQQTRTIQCSLCQAAYKESEVFCPICYIKTPPIQKAKYPIAGDIVECYYCHNDFTVQEKVDGQWYPHSDYCSQLCYNQAMAGEEIYEV